MLESLKAPTRRSHFRVLVNWADGSLSSLANSDKIQEVHTLDGNARSQVIAASLITATLLWGVYWSSPDSSFAVAFIGILLATLAWTDFCWLRLPDALCLALFASGTALALLYDPATFAEHALASALGGGLLAGVRTMHFVVRKKHGLGLGDVKLMTAAGPLLLPGDIPPLILLASFCGLVWGCLASWISGRPIGSEKVPFGTFLCLGIWMAALGELPPLSYSQ